MNMNHSNMAGLNGGGPPGVPMMHNGVNGATPRIENEQELEYETRLNTWIYDHFVRKELYGPAQAMVSSQMNIRFRPNKSSPGRRAEVNGTDEGIMETDMKDEIDSKRPENLPQAEVGSDKAETSILMEWFCLYWDFWMAQRKRQGATSQASQYVSHTQQQAKIRQEQQAQLLSRQMPQQMMPGGMNNYQNVMRGLQANGVPMNQNDLRQRALQNNRNATPQQIAQIQQNKQNQMMQHQQMQRDGSDIDINGQRPRTPSSGDNAPSPTKRPRLESGSFNGQQIMVNGRGPPQGLPGQQMMSHPGGHTNKMLAQHGINPNQLSQQQLESLQNQNYAVQQKSIQLYSNNNLQQPIRQGMPNPGISAQGSPMMQPNLDISSEFYGGGNPTSLPMQVRGLTAPNGGGSHALHDYQMQLMLLEQQNKKRLLMARQEQDDMTRPNGQAPYPPGMSPQGSRSGPSPGPNDQMKRGTPKMGQAGLPSSPLPDGSMPQARGSPAAMTFNSHVSPEMYQHMKALESGMGGMAPNMRPPSSHPQFNNVQMNPQQHMELMRANAQAQNGGGMGGVVWQQRPQGQAPMIQPPPQGQQQMGTPQTRNAMPPPQAPPAGGAVNGRPGSPQQAAAPPTPQQSKQPNPKGKKDSKAKRPAKKNSTTNGGSVATPSADAENPPPTPTPSTPITPIHSASFSNQKNGSGQNQSTGIQAPTSAPASAAPVGLTQPQPDSASVPQFDTSLGGVEDTNFNMNFSGMDTADVLESFDFDSFLHDSEGGFNFDTTAFGIPGDGVEAGGGDA